MAGEDFEKQDRVIRLLRELALFQARPRGMTARELAEEVNVSERTVQRDVAALEELHIPFVKQGARWTVASDYWLAPIVFDLNEAMAMLLSARLMLRFADRANPFAVTAYEKVAAALPQPMKAPVMETAELLATRRSDDTYVKVLTALTWAWAERRKVVITYTTTESFERSVWPLFLEPNPGGHSSYLIAWDEKRRAPRSYRLERISAVRVREERFDWPLGFSVHRHLAHAWGVWSSDQPVEVQLKFAPEVAKRVTETVWHASQTAERQPDGSVMLRLQVAEPTELKHWVLGWGVACEVVAPATFREDVAHEAAALANLYPSSSTSYLRRPRAG